MSRAAAYVQHHAYCHPIDGAPGCTCGMVQFVAAHDALVTAARAGCHALISYQYGNKAPGLAESCAEALRVAIEHATNAMNIALLERVKAHILAHPEQFRMDTWSCGSAHCIAGTALMLVGQRVENPEDDPDDQRLASGREPEDAAKWVLGLARACDSDRLFHLGEWPPSIRRAYDAATSHAERAKIAATRIDHFIATGGAQ